MSADDDEPHIRIHLPGPFDHFQATHGRHADIRHNNIDLVAASQYVQSRHAVGGQMNVELLSKAHAEAGPYVFLVVDE